MLYARVFHVFVSLLSRNRKWKFFKAYNISLKQGSIVFYALGPTQELVLNQIPLLS